MKTDIDDVTNLLMHYFNGLFHGDTAILEKVFHPDFLYASATDGELLLLKKHRYFEVVEGRPSPASLGESRHDKIISIELAGPVTAYARVECRITGKCFTDFLGMVKLNGQWKIISKVFHYDLCTTQR